MHMIILSILYLITTTSCQSTFYNAVTRAVLDTRGHRHLAEVAPHPFTTIEPNVAPGWYASFHNDAVGDSGGCSGVRSSLHGRWDLYTIDEDAPSIPIEATSDSPAMLCHASESYRKRRVLPLIIKDVAGLVPGAYKGRGKGNRFLSDLCDADVLVHVVDVTGKSDRDGNIINSSLIEGDAGKEFDAQNAVEQAKGSTPSEDAEWIRYELHRWIFNNVRAKWHTVGRKGDNKCMPRVVALFSGYKGQSWNVEMAAQRAHLNLDAANTWCDLLSAAECNFLKLRHCDSTDEQNTRIFSFFVF
jgi:ribosome-binding ATPase